MDFEDYTICEPIPYWEDEEYITSYPIPVSGSMFTPGWYTPQQILDMTDKDDIIFVDGLSHTPEQLKDFKRLRYYRSDGNEHMFTMLPR